LRFGVVVLCCCCMCCVCTAAVLFVLLLYVLFCGFFFLRFGVVVARSLLPLCFVDFMLVRMFFYCFLLPCVALVLAFDLFSRRILKHNMNTRKIYMPDKKKFRFFLKYFFKKSDVALKFYFKF
jgi:hypothetical protein